MAGARRGGETCARAATPPRSAPAILVLFWPLVVVVLFGDSRWAAARGWALPWAGAVLAAVFLLALLRQLPPERRLAVMLFVPLSALGEVLFSLVFGFYRYRAGGVPLYVPLGHSVLLAVGLLVADLPVVRRHEDRIGRGLFGLHAGLIAGALLLWGDTVSLLFGVLLIPIVFRGGPRPFFGILGLLVFYIELVGTALGCWTWEPRPFGLLHATNPPVAAFPCYLAGELVAIRLADLLRRYFAGGTVSRLAGRRVVAILAASTASLLQNRPVAGEMSSPAQRGVGALGSAPRIPQPRPRTDSQATNLR